MALALTRFIRLKFLLVFVLLTILGVLIIHSPDLVSQLSTPEGSLHLIVPATSSNADLCKLLLSAAILGYPTPVLINWGATENKDPYVQHLAKVWTILEYLDTLSDSGKGEELVLIVDGFDVHFQLPPEVIISRYYQENERANKRIVELHGEEMATEYNMKQTVIFGHDKLCWPMDDRRPACWVVPEASDPKYAYGPYTDSSAAFARAKWLNSGTVIGPVDDVKDIFRATLDLIHTKHTTDSDQFYFANVFAAQEYGRRLLNPVDPWNGTKGEDKESVDWPEIAEGQRTEYFLGLDYEAVMFQTMAFFREYITWMTFEVKQPKVDTWSITQTKQHILQDDWYRTRILPADVRLARGPFDDLRASKRLAKRGEAKQKQKVPLGVSWQHLRLGSNVISGQIFPLLHFTGDKSFRDKWWPRLWFVSMGEELLEAAMVQRRNEEQRLGSALITKRKIGGKTWWHGEVVGKDVPDTINWEPKGGAFGGNGTFLGWGELCSAHEKILFPA